MTLRKRLRGSRGAELIELALVLPLLLVLIGGIVDFAFMFQAFEALNNAAREGARTRVLPGYTDADVQTRVQAYLTAAGLPATPVTAVTQVTLGAGATASRGYQVQVTYVHQFTMLRSFVANSVTLVARSVMRSET